MGTKIRSRVSTALCVAIAGLLSGCSSSDRADAARLPASLSLRGAGATFLSLLYKKWLAEYQKSHSDVSVSYDGVGSGEGVRGFIGNDVKPEDAVDFAGSDAALIGEHLGEVRRGALMVPVTQAASSW